MSAPTPTPPDKSQLFEFQRDRRPNVEINVGKACNNKCVFCLDGLPKAEDRSYIAFDTMQAELERFYADGARSVGFLGGEPTTYPKLPHSIAYAKELGYSRIAIATNATRLRLEHYQERLLDAGLTRVTVSSHGHTAALEDKLTRVPGNFEKKQQALKLLVKARDAGRLVDNVSVNIVVNGWNYKVLPKMLKYFFSLGIDDVRANFIRTEGYATEDKSLTPTYKQVVPVLVKTVLLNEFHWKKNFTFGGFPMCVLPLEFLGNWRLAQRYVGEFRDLDTSCSIRAENTHGLAKVDGGRARFNWQDRKRYDLKHHLDACQGCRFSDVCEGVWGYYLGEHGEREFRAIP